MGGTVTDKAAKAIHIQWVRSGIGFTRHQKKMVRSLGLLRLNQVVERPDTPQIRGLVETIPHLVKIVRAPATPAWMSVPEYTILPPDPAAVPVARPAKVKPAKAERAGGETGAEELVSREGEKAEVEKAAAHAEKTAKTKKPAKTPAGKGKPAKAAEVKKIKGAEKSSKAGKKPKK
jgi:large subunit ribosomal protein L30